jgi:3-(3-hydroxy-phenyl)propionate hydroxylase
MQLTQDDGHVTVTVSAADGVEQQLQGRFLVGCDGGRSTVRQAMAIPVHSFNFDQPWVVVDTFLHEGVSNAEAGLPVIHEQRCNPARPISFIPGVYVAGLGQHNRFEFMVIEGETKDGLAQSEQIRQLLAGVCDLSKLEIGRSAGYVFHALRPILAAGARLSRRRCRPSDATLCGAGHVRRDS